MSDELDLDAIEARASAATPGEWEWRGFDLARDGRSERSALVAPRASGGQDYVIEGRVQSWNEGEPAMAVRDADAEFIAAARYDVPALVAEVRRLREALKPLPLR